MLETLAILACIILFSLTLFQLSLILGAPIGRFAWGGSHNVLPRNLRIGSAISIILYVLFSIVILEAAGLINLLSNDSFTNAGIWVLAVYFTVGVFMNGISRSKPERNLMTPVALVLAVSTAVLAFN